jgi:hypothetical protein
MPVVFNLALNFQVIFLRYGLKFKFKKKRLKGIVSRKFAMLLLAPLQR